MSRVSSMLVTSDDINAFAAKEKAAEELLPQILRKLVLASAKTATEIAFPTGKAINEGGWDGQVTCKTAELFVPSGKSGWELTARRDQVTKAQGDYDERLKSVDSVDQKKTTFIHWNMRKWGEAAREKWIKERKNEEKWLDVCAYDAKSLETWLLNHLGIHLWVSERMGKKPVDAQDIFSFWSDWSHTSTPPLTPEILTVGYEIQRSAIFEAIEQNSPTISIQWERPDLVTAFVAAIMTSSSDPKIEQIASRCIYIKTQQAFDALASQHQGLILIPAFRPENTGIAQSNGHTIILSLGRDAERGNQIALKGRTSSQLYDAMDSWEPVDERRRQYAERAAKKFTSFRRSLVPPGKETTPEWSNKRNAPLLLAGKWDRNFEGDQELVSLLTGALFDVENEHAIDLSKATDALFVQTGSIIAVADPEDGWTYLGRHINDKHLTAFIDAILTAFKETDPQYEFDDPNESSALAMYPDRKGKLRYSLSLRQGLAESLCYLGANGEEINVTGVTRGDIVATLVVRKLFGQATTWKHFCSMAPWFREMAEASPDEFLTALEKTIKGQPEKVASLFRDKSQDFFFGGSSAHTTLLWALEILAWSPEHVTRVAIILAKLSHLDPGGRTANRPESSLRSIFIPWYPGTLADTKHRQDCLKKIASFDSKLCFALLVKLLPTGHSFAMPNARAKYRPWGPLWQLPLTYGDIWTATDDITELAIECAGSDAANWVKIIESISEFRQVGFDNAIAGLGKYLECAGPEDLALVRESVRKLLAQHTSHPSAEWIMSNERLEKLQEILAEIPIKDSVEKWKWAFSDHAIFELGPGNDFAAKQLELNALQAKAVQEIYDEARLMGLLNLAASSSTPWNVGFAVSKIEIKETLDEAVAASCSAGESGILFALGLANSVANHSGWEIVWKLISSSWGVAQDVSLVARFLALIPFSRETMARLSEMSIDIQEQYWGRFDPFQFIRGDHDRELSESALAELCKFDRFATAVKGLGWIVRDGERILNPEIILTTLEGALRSQEMRPEHWSGLTHELGEILDVLDKARVDSSRLGWLEMNFSNLLSFTRKPKHLNRLVSDDPSLFVLLLSAVYKSKLEVDPQADTSIPPMVAYEVLKGLETLPGQIDKTTIDGRKLLDWVKEGQVLAKEIGRQEVFEENLGEWFAHSPPGEDGIKPHEAVREVFQVLESKHLEDGYSIGVYNSRGVVSKHPEEGGEQERELGEAFKKAADALASKWHRVALALTRISASYYDEAKREDLRKGLD